MRGVYYGVEQFSPRRLLLSNLPIQSHLNISYPAASWERDPLAVYQIPSHLTPKPSQTSHTGHLKPSSSSMPKRSGKRKKSARSGRQQPKPTGAGSEAETEPTFTKYIHEPLPDGERFFRLLELLPGKGGSVIQCRLKIHSINFHPSYDAISYVWGRPEDKTSILCNRKHLRIPFFLCNALEELRYENTSRILWADSICINQEDTNERGHQVQLMRSIFYQAENVQAWLGRGTKCNAHVAFQLIDAIYEEWASGDWHHLSEVVRKVPDSHWSELRRILGYPWFRRLWILQEVGLASNAILLCGHNKIRWKKVVGPCSYLIQIFPWIHSVHRVNLGTIRYMNRDFRNGVNEDVRSILHVARVRKCSDMKDLVYGVLGHAAFKRLQNKTSGKAFIEVDYALGLPEIYFQVATSLLSLPDPLFMLSLVKHQGDTFDGQETPSWVPSWHINSYAPRLIREHYVGPRYQASGETTPHFTIKGKQIAVHGVCVDSVDWQSDIFDVRNNDTIMMSVWKQITRTDQGRNNSETDFLKRFCFTMCADSTSERMGRNWFSHRTTDEELENCLSYLRSVDIEGEAVDSLSTKYPGGDKSIFLEDQGWYRSQRRFFISNKGFFGLGPEVALAGDKICVFFGSRVPFVLRPVPESGKYRLCGDCYFDEWMYGKVVDMVEAGLLQEETFTLV